ncbi:DsbC family protein [Microvirgula aerodenitrificans]|uniref:DsbC family protein n=1 Tax=Microvirgula aerodenitrificans TaxID=57480 RepID=UPI000491664C|nr:DsbC family protein [Microvirgula aerodenitrificans]
MRKLRTLATALMFIPLFACAVEGDGNTAAVKKSFEQKFPQREVQSVSASPVKGVYEVVLAGRQIVYTDAKVTHLFVGDLIDVQNKKSLTEERMAALSKVNWADLPLELAIKDVRGDGSRKLAVFSDPDCPFCKRLERDSLPGLNNVTIYTFLLPLTELHPDAMNKSKKIWCSKDRLASWTGVMRDGKALTGDGNCDTAALDRIQALGKKLGVTGTPALVFGNGQLVAGAIPRDDIDKLLSSK